MSKEAEAQQSSPVEGQDAGNAEPQEPTVEELKQAVIEASQARDKDQAEIKRLQGVIKSQGVTKSDIEALKQEFGGMQDWVADALDAMRETESTFGEFDKPKQTYKAKLDAVRKEKASQGQAMSQDEQMFFGYMISQGLTVQDEIVKEALSDGRTAAEAFTYLKSSIDAKTEQKITKRVQEETDQKLESALKKLGLSGVGAGAPTGGGRTFTRRQIADMTDEEYLQLKPQIQEAIAAGRVKD